MTNNFSILHFSDLTTLQLFDVLALRAKIFVVEQNCPYQDPDELDLIAYHALLYQNEKLIGTARIIPPQEDAPAKIGRVVVDKSARMAGYGKQIMQECIVFCESKYPKASIFISAQQYLDKFYCDLGFVKTGDFYLEDNIPHQAMIYEKV